MPLVKCDHCGREQIVRREMDGLIVVCERCDTEFRATSNRPKDAKPEFVGAPAQPFPAGKTALMLGGLLLGVGLIFGIAVLIINAGKPDAKPTADQPKPVRTEPPKPKEPTVTDKDVNRAKGAIGGIILVGVVFLVVVYGLLVLVAGAWIARDASVRGMNSLGWPWFYYFFQVFGRVVSLLLTLPFSAMAAFIDPSLSILILLLVEPIAWFGLAVYFSARRHGRLSLCGRCARKRLRYLVVCPICGATDPQSERS